jgi:two-component system, OmpR family, response regulator
MHILIIEDEQQLCQSIAEGLRMDGYEADTCFDGDEGLELCLVENYDLILLDLNLPGVDGLEILRQFRESDTSTPVLILSARGQIQDKVEGLDLGANDYLTKPFHFEELEARIRSLTRRKFIQQDVCLQCGRISFDTRTRKASIDGLPLSLTRKESSLLEYFLLHQNRIISPEDVKSVGKFETTGIDGKTYTEKVFSDYDLTLVNVFTTWCSPCVKEIPELQELYKEMKDKGVGVAGVVLDTTDEKGNQDEEAVKKAGILQEKTKAEYPFLTPDTTMMNGRLQGISAFPETFFVDKDGNIVGDTYTGSHTLDEWKEIVEKELKNVSK